MSKQNIKNKKSNLAGYRLHLERLRFSGKQSIRTVKFPLLPYDVNGKRGKKEKKQGYKNRIQDEAKNNEFFQNFVQSVRSDYENMYGPLNLTSYIENSEKNDDEKLYSLKDFWVDSLKAGVTMHHNVAKRNDILKIVEGKAGDIDNEQKKKMQEANKEFFDIIDFEKFKKEFILKSQKRTGANVRRMIEDCILKKYIESGRANSIIDSFVNDYRDLMEQGSNQEEYLRENYGVDKSLYKSKSDGIGGKQDKVASSTFYIYPIFEFNKDLSVERCVKRVDEFITDRGLNKKTEELIGISDNAGGFSSYFNIILDALKNSEVKELKDSIIGMSDLWKGKEDDLQERLQFLSNQAKKLDKPDLVKNWHEYRADIGGSIQSWVSNSLRQDTIIRNLLYGYIKIKNDKNNLKFRDVSVSDGQVVTHNQESEDVLEDGHIDELNEVLGESEMGGYLKHFQEKSDEEGIRQTEEVIAKVEQLKKHLDDEKENIDTKQPKIDTAILDDYRDILADFRNTFNHLYQKRYGLEEQDESVEQKNEKGKKIPTVNKKYPNLFKELPKIPKFLGEVKTEDKGAYDKYMLSHSGLKEGVKFLGGITYDSSYRIDDYYTYKNNSDKGEGEIEKARKRNIERVQRVLENVLRLYKSTDAKQLKNQKIKYLLGKYCKDISLLDRENSHIYRNERYARDKRGEKIELKYIDDGLIQDDFIQGLIEDLDSFQWHLDGINSDEWCHRVKEWGAIIEIEKIKIGLMAWFYEISVPYGFEEIAKNKLHFRKVEAIVRRYNQDEVLDNKEKNTIIQQGIVSEMRGIIAQMSRQEIIARYVVQPMNADTKYPLVMDNRRYYIYPKEILKKQDRDGLVEMTYISKEKKLTITKDSTILVNKDNSFAIHSSKYQTQFLNNSLNKQLDRWRNMKPELSEWSFIVEDTHKIKWNKNGNSYVPDCEEKENTRLFIAIPFKIGFEDKKKTIEIKKQNKFIGIDIGEYGVAYYGLDGSNFSKEPFVSGFFYQPDMRKIREGIAANKERQKAGTFTNPNTQIKRVRDNATTKIRNKIHQLVIENDAFPIYEREVSAFESGSGKISAIYNSIKRSDVCAELMVDQLEHKLIWGNDKLIVGMEIGAYATSYMCSCCYESIYAYIAKDDYEKMYEVINRIEPPKQVKDKWNTTVKFDVDGKKVWAYIEQKDKAANVGDKYNGKDTINFIRKYQRPPLDVARKEKKLPLAIQQELSEYTKKERVKSNGEKEKISVWENERGSQGVFRCAFCNECSDADIQAAMWIALKGYLQNVKNAVQKKDNKEQYKIYEGSIGREAMEEIATGFSQGGKEQVRFILGFAKSHKASLE